MQQVKLFKAQYQGKEVIGFERTTEKTDFFICERVMEILENPNTSVERADKILNEMLQRFNRDIKQSFML